MYGSIFNGWIAQLHKTVKSEDTAGLPYIPMDVLRRIYTRI